MTAGFTLTKILDCSPEHAWRLLTDPEQMNRWSTAPIALDDPGVDGRADAVGALRTVTLPGSGTRLREVVEVADPPRLFRYRVYDGGPLLVSHAGEQAIAEHPRGCLLVWRVEIELVPGPAGRLLSRVIARQVGESLDRLARIAADEHARPDDADSRDFGDLVAAANRSRDAQQVVADRLAATDDPKQWFARVYQYVTEEMLAAAVGPNQLSLDHPDWVLTLIPVFHDYFARNLAAYESGEGAEEPWQHAWSLCEKTDERRPHIPVVEGLMAGVAAHIDFDLPRALRDVALASYPGRDLREFRPDYLRLAPVFTAASDRLLLDLPAHYQPWWTSLATRVHPPLRDALLARRGYHVGKHRLDAFAAAVELVGAAPAAAPVPTG